MDIVCVNLWMLFIWVDEYILPFLNSHWKNAFL